MKSSNKFTIMMILIILVILLKSNPNPTQNPTQPKIHRVKPNLGCSVGLIAWHGACADPAGSSCSSLFVATL